MPGFGRAHHLLSGRHPDTSPPAAGAYPEDGQVVAWSTALLAWRAADPAGGVTDHGALTGLVPDDDHSQYALADKSRPATWVSAANLGARSLADLGTKDHHLLGGLGDDDHSIYALLSGRSGGQSFIGGAGSGDHLTLQSTSHGTRGYVRAQDDLQLLSDIIRDSGGNARITLDTASPHVALGGDVEVGGHASIGTGSIVAGRALSLVSNAAQTQNVGGFFQMTGDKAGAGVMLAMGLAGGAVGQGTPTASLVYGLFFSATHASSTACNTLANMNLTLASKTTGVGAISTAYGIKFAESSWLGSLPALLYGIYMDALGHASVGTLHGLDIADQTATTVRLLELGPAVPYLRLVGGADPAAGDTNLFLKVGGSLMQVYVQSNYLRVK